MNLRQGLLIMFLPLLLTGCFFKLTDADGNPLSLHKDEGGYFVNANLAGMGATIPNPTKLVVNVKGSIYETGELMSVFGTCLDGDGSVVNGTSALFSSWYPNGTQFVNSSSMQTIQPGYFLYQANMSAVQGTYLTEMDCFANISGTMYTAAAWGEWQNPYWVKRLELLNESLSNLSIDLSNVTVNATVDFSNLTNLIQNISIQIGNLSVNMSDSFNLTWEKLDQINASVNNSFYYLNQSIYDVALIANASVDRNDSYLAQLILNLTAITSPSGSLNYTYEADVPIYHKDWEITVTAKSPLNGKTVKYPDAICTISTSQTPGPTDMTPQGSRFIYSEEITSLSPFNWSVSCAYA